MRKTNLATSLVLLALTAGTLSQIRNLPVGNFRLPQAGFFPLLITGVLGILALILLFQALRDKEKSSGSFRASLGEWEKVTWTVAALVGFVFIFEPLGFLISTFLLMAFLLLAVGGQRWRTVMATAVISAVVWYLLFDPLLKASFPPGLLKGMLGSWAESGYLLGPDCQHVTWAMPCSWS